ncbi:hypothetical protein KP509_30G042800 [Ceratopteris richardii]|uniref:Dof-type domain-containing protein n=1 Tax=Ceratopteris richardii TaxID=49495 RepID=A0A8T2R1V6_CERRI|nr:hypothetical protein KP509_30G042800 [Ceratopteris richardii]
MVACDPSRPHPPEGLKCPRCESTDTKFCYYNNYNTSQPRHFCKSCKRYWTAGGSLRNVPVGGGLRKNKKSKLLNQVKDMVSSSSDEILQGGSLAPNSAYSIAPDGLAYDASRSLPFVSPLYVTGASSPADRVQDGSLTGAQVCRGINSMSYGYFPDNHGDEHTMSGMDPSLVNCMNVRQETHCQENYNRPFLEGMHLQQNENLYDPRSMIVHDQAKVYDQGFSQFPSALSQSISNDAQVSQPVDLYDEQVDKVHALGDELKKVEREGSTEASVITGQPSVCDFGKTIKQENISAPDQLRYVEESHLRDICSTEGEDDELGNVINVRYPYDWEQVSEVLFGGGSDYFQLSGY